MAIVDIIRATSLEVTPGLELLDNSDVLIQDISNDLLDGSIEHDNEASLPGMARIVLAEAYDWESQRLRPYITLTDNDTGDSQTWNLGVYIPATPERQTNTTPPIYTVDAYDKLSVFDTAYGATYRVASGANYLTTIDALITALGEATGGVARDAATKTLPEDMVWPLDGKNTYLVIINDLLNAIGYTKAYTDRDGLVSSEPVTIFSEAGIVFNYTTGEDTIITPDYKQTSDIYGIPNKWVFLNADPAGALPSEGAGVYTVLNQSDGPTSIDTRGRTFTVVESLEAADQTTLVVLGDAFVEKDRQAHEEVELSTSANPLHWHNNIVTLDAPDLGISAGTRFSELSWSLPLRGGMSSHTLRRTVSV